MCVGDFDSSFAIKVIHTHSVADAVADPVADAEADAVYFLRLR